MPIVSIIVIASWVAFIAYWSVSAIGVKRDVSETKWGRNVVNRMVILVIVLTIFWLGLHFGLLQYHFSDTVEDIGAALTVVGIAFAIWARWHLGKNWSGTPAMKEDHELITSGPYKFVRHPIYTGMLVAVLGSTLTGGWLWLTVFVVSCFYVFAKIPVEERYMLELFPDTYPTYKNRTKALVPFVW